MPLTLRPGNFLFGPRLGGRQAAFVCYAGMQTEDIEATFDKDLPLPAPLLGVRIENPLFTYWSGYKIENRTLKINRQFLSRVPGQVCAPETEAKIAADLDRVRADINTAYRFPGAGVATPAAVSPTPSPIPNLTRVAVEGQRRTLDFLYALNADCSSMGETVVTVVEPAQHGKVVSGPGTGRTGFAQNNSRFECNTRQSEGTLVNYDPAPGFTGADVNGRNSLPQRPHNKAAVHNQRGANPRGGRRAGRCADPADTGGDCRRTSYS